MVLSAGWTLLSTFLVSELYLEFLDFVVDLRDGILVILVHFHANLLIERVDVPNLGLALELLDSLLQLMERDFDISYALFVVFNMHRGNYQCELF